MRVKPATFYDLSFAYWLPPVFARFDPRPESDNRHVTNALTQLSRQNLVAKARLATAESGHVEWEELPPKEWFQHHVDCHPLVREYFGHQLRTHYAEAFRAAHGRLYDHFRYEGLPEVFRDPVAYAFLALDSSYPRDSDFEISKMISGPYPEHLKRYLTPPLPALLDRSDRSIARLKAADTLRKSPAATAALQRFLPATEAGMTPLFAAIGHGCLAGRHDECFNEVYWPRTARGNEGFAVRRLGLWGQNLASLANFFEVPFRTPSTRLQAFDQALVLNLAGFALRAIGRLPDAIEPFRAAVEAGIAEHNWRGAAANAGNLSELLLTLGHLERNAERQPGALPTAEQAVRFADQSEDLFIRQTARSSWNGNALLAAGRLSQAEALFREAESLQRERQSSLPRLYTLQGFLYGDLLLARRRPGEVAERYRYLVSVRMQSDSLLDYGLEELNQARAQALLGQSPRTADHAHPDFLKALLDANQEAYIVPGYLAQAEIFLNAEGGRRTAETIDAALTEAETRARRGPMPLFLAEAYLLRSRWSEIRGQKSEARKWRDQAAELIRKHGYGRREPDLAVLNCELDPRLENFQTACAKVGGEGWWHLMPRLEALVAAQPSGFLGTGPANTGTHLLEPLRKAEKAYHRERDEYLRNVEEGTARTQSQADALLARLPQEVVQEIATQTGAPADWRQWPDELKAQAAKLIIEAQQRSGS